MPDRIPTQADADQAVDDALDNVQRKYAKATDDLAAERRRFDFLASMEGMSLAWFCSVHGTTVADGAKDEDPDAWRAAIDRILGGART